MNRPVGRPVFLFIVSPDHGSKSGHLLTVHGIRWARMGQSFLVLLRDQLAFLKPLNRLIFVREQPKVHETILRDVLDQLHVLFVF